MSSSYLDEPPRGDRTRSRTPQYGGEDDRAPPRRSPRDSARGDSPSPRKPAGRSRNANYDGGDEDDDFARKASPRNNSRRREDPPPPRREKSDRYDDRRRKPAENGYDDPPPPRRSGRDRDQDDDREPPRRKQRDPYDDDEPPRRKDTVRDYARENERRRPPPKRYDGKNGEPTYDTGHGGHYGASAQIAANGHAPPPETFTGHWGNVSVCATVIATLC